jgi:hypothetical protein
MRRQQRKSEKWLNRRKEKKSLFSADLFTPFGAKTFVPLTFSPTDIIARWHLSSHGITTYYENIVMPLGQSNIFATKTLMTVTFMSWWHL